MATTVAQLIDETFGQNGNDQELVQTYRVSGVDTSYLASLASGLPRVGYYYQGTFMRCESIEVERWQIKTNYKVTVTYRFKWNYEQPIVEEGDEFWEVNFGTERARVTNAYSQVSYGSAPRDVDVLLNVDDSGIPQGVDILAPSTSLTVSRYFAADDITASFLRKVDDEVTKVNSREFYGYEAGELIFLGATIGTKPDNAELVPIEFSFGVSKNLDAEDLTGKYTDIKDGNSAIEITNGKKGWEYLWADNLSDANEDDGEATFGSRGVYVAQVYEESTFSDLSLSGDL